MRKRSVLALALLLALAQAPGALADSGAQPTPEQGSLHQPAPPDERAAGSAETAAADSRATRVQLLPLVAIGIVSPLMLIGVVFAMYRIANKPRQHKPK